MTQDHIRVLLVDDEPLMRAGIRLMVDGVDGIEVVGEAADGHEAIEAVAHHDPDVVLMDIRMPRMDGLEATQVLKDSEARASIVVLTAFDTDNFLLDALRLGACSFLLKDSTPEALLRAIRDAATDQPMISAGVLQRLVALARLPEDEPGDRPGPSVPPPPQYVTAREWEVARCIAQGLTNAEIAETLFLSPTTIKTHLASLFAKLHVTNRVQLAIRVLEAER
ncbi:MAG TPA: response regulator transcription factor [Beutenbergiaceae bacterium]|nr:response regulator transcription factor [Beutenbergiaceae bacterium]